MNVRDRLRRAFLQKEASRVCWRCTLSPRQRLRAVRTAVPTTRSSEVDIAPTELELLLGKVLPRSPDLSRSPSVSGYRDVECSHADSAKPSVVTGNDEAQELVPRPSTGFILRYQLEGGNRPGDGFEKRLGLSNLGPTTLGDMKQSRVAEPTSWKRSLGYLGRGWTEEVSIQTTPASRSRWRLCKYAGPNHRPVYVFRAGHKRRICMIYYEDVLKEETESLFNTWLEVSDPPRLERFSQSASNRQLATGEGWSFNTNGTKFHTSAIFLSPLEGQKSSPSESDIASQLPSVSAVGIRKHLTLWQELQSKEITEATPSDFQGPERYDTAENTITLSGEEDSAQVSESIDPASARDWGLISSSEKDDEGDTDVHEFLRPGDVVGFNTKIESMLALFVRNFESQSQFYDMRGRWLHRISFGGMFTMRNVFSQREVDSIVPFLPDKQVDSDALDKFKAMEVDVPREVGADLIEKLQAIQSESAEIYRNHSERLDRVHSLVAHEFLPKEMTLQEIALVVLQKQHVDELTKEMLWAVTKALAKNPNFRSPDNIFHRSAPLWKVNSSMLMREFEQARVWIRDYVEGVAEQAASSQLGPFPDAVEEKSQDSNPIPGFIRKAKSLVQISRTHRSVTDLYGLGPSSRPDVAGNLQQGSVVQISHLTKFDPMETSIIKSLKTWCISRDIRSTGSAWSLPPMLLRATGLYEGQTLDEAIGFLFLQEVGVIAPWENRFLYESKVRLRNPATYPSEVESIRTVGAAADPSTHHIKDCLEGLRKDWGGMSVYCIDDAEAKEIDDGISLERIAGDDSISWVHVHVANPSAFISPDSAVGQFAADLQQSIYLPDKTYPMLNPKLTQEHFSLARNRPVLTFSAKISLDGEMQETAITPGWVRNTKKVTPRSVDDKLGLGRESFEGVSRLLQVGQHVKSSPQATAEDDLSPSDISDLLTLQKLGSARRLKRNGNEGPRSFQASVPQPYVYIASKRIGLNFQSRYGRQFIGDPSISWEAREVDLTAERSQDHAGALVADIMNIAGEAAARWCSQRNIPIPYRGTIPNPAPPISPQTYKSEVIDRSMSEMGYVPLTLYRNYNRLRGQSTTRPHPFRHVFLGVESYAKVTSPLRRYMDMLSHWQIQAALLYEAKHGKDSLINDHHPSSSPSSSSPPPFSPSSPRSDGTESAQAAEKQSYLPFSYASLAALLPQMEIRQRNVRDMMKLSSAHWIMQLLHRAFYFGEDTLPERLEVLVHAEPKSLRANRTAIGYVKQLS
ncbi:MAG: hypothetical protein Q9196_002207, partial [Gyalolechia fulgens]